MKRITILVAIVSMIMSFGYVRPAFAADSSPIDTVKAWADGIKFVSALTKSDGENMGQLVNKFGIGIADVALGYGCPACTESNPEISQADIPESMKLGLSGIVENQVVAMFEAQPQVDVMAHLAEEWVPGYDGSQSTYAAGYDDLKSTGIDSLWSFTRNIAYLGFVLVMIVIGFMIMFRNKIGGQMLVTVGNTLPRVIVALVLVTFSFAIIGLILDFAGIVMNVVSGKSFFDGGIPIHNLWALFSGSWVSSPVLSGTGTTLGIAGIVLAFASIGGGVIALIFALCVLGFVIFGALKLWFTLLKSYLGILMSVAIAPLTIMLGSLPGNESMISNLFKSVLRNALVFPVAYAIVNIPYFLLDQGGFSLGFPQSILGEDAGGVGGSIVEIVIASAKILAIYAAAQTPEYMKAIIPATASKSGADAAGALKAGLGKVPLIGGMFGGK